LITAGADFARNAVKEAIVSSVGFNALSPVSIISTVNVNATTRGTLLIPTSAAQPITSHPSFLMALTAKLQQQQRLVGSNRLNPVISRRTGSSAQDNARRFDTSAFGPAPVDFAGLGRAMCDDLTSRGTGTMDDYYKGLSDYVWSWRFPILKTCGWILFLGVGLAIIWMAVVSKYAEGLIRFAIIMSLVTLVVEAAIDFAMGNIPGGIIVCIYLLFKVTSSPYLTPSAYLIPISDRCTCPDCTF
jgi:hypothetical protein